MSDVSAGLRRTPILQHAALGQNVAAFIGVGVGGPVPSASCILPGDEEVIDLNSCQIRLNTQVLSGLGFGSDDTVTRQFTFSGLLNVGAGHGGFSLVAGTGVTGSPVSPNFSPDAGDSQVNLTVTFERVSD
jgi:hypothetical protein